MNVKVFTVLMGREEGDVDPGDFDPFGRQPYAVNPELLKKIARVTQGQYYHAGDTAALDRGFEEVRATLEKSKRREIGKRYEELYPLLLTPALALLLAELLLAMTRFRRFP